MLNGIRVNVLKVVKKMENVEYVKVAELADMTVRATGYVGSVSGKGTIKLSGRIVNVKKVHGGWFALASDIK